VTRASDCIAVPQGKILVDDRAKWVCISDGDYPTSIYLTDDTTGKVIARADTNPDWSRDEITYLDNEQMIDRLCSAS